MEKQNFWLNGNPDNPHKLLTEPVIREDGKLVRVTAGKTVVILKTGSVGFAFTNDYIEKIGEGSFIHGVFKLAKLGIESSGKSRPDFNLLES